jgi:hypothetical protein
MARDLEGPLPARPPGAPGLDAAPRPHLTPTAPADLAAGKGGPPSGAVFARLASGR